MEDRLTFHLSEHDEVGSTNTLIKQAIEQGAPEGTAVCARVQTGGYGRQGRAWKSPQGGLYLSVLLRPDVAVAQLPTLSLVVGLAVRRALVAVCGGDADRGDPQGSSVHLPASDEIAASDVPTASVPDIRVKWPNDVVCSACPSGTSGDADAAGFRSTSPSRSRNASRTEVRFGISSRESEALQKPSLTPLGQPALFQKLCGISLEQHAGALCVGIGVNVVRPAAAPEVGGKNTAAYLQDLCAQGPGQTLPDIARVRAAILDELAVLYPRWTRDAFSAFVDEYNAHAALTGMTVSVQRADGTTIARGVAGNVDNNGHLLVDSYNGKIQIATGEIHVVLGP
ncbi:biotin--[acetyl-CoA-carboxylase] ligase [Adlercreutzia murintestinalis]|uniref:biotin--[acetyl-CoA-carboxylase] ligase n=1 Tax=Adlercreutzia murintestinalis TaxID=2941325 RepID=UPI00203F6174|nr:biotin--[acetyl-CoA-carboxylase] ligase [Adlercreutzia murintestinalis]